jgi:hypothetical protein
MSFASSSDIRLEKSLKITSTIAGQARFRSARPFSVIAT